MMRAGILALLLFLCVPKESQAEWQIRPFMGVTFGGSTTFVDLAGAAGGTNVVVGVNGALLGNVFGIDVDFGHAPGFFESGDQHLVVSSSATTLTGSLVVSPPRRSTEYTLGPYFVIGAGLMHVGFTDFLDVFSVSRTLPAMNIGGGANGFLSDRYGLGWDVRYFRNLGGQAPKGLSFGREKLAFWRATMAFVIRR